MKNFFFTFCILIVLLFGCHSPMFKERIKISEYGWRKDSLVKFFSDITDTSSVYNFIIEIRNSVHYRYMNLFVKLRGKSPSGKESEELLDLPLADKEGKWFGDALGDIVDNRILVREKYKFSEKGKYEFSLQQYMREDTLRQVLEAGLVIEKTK